MMLLNESIFNTKNSNKHSSNNAHVKHNSNFNMNSDSNVNSNSIYKQTYMKMYVQCYLNLLFCLSYINNHTETVYHINRLYCNIKRFSIAVTSFPNLQSITTNYLINAYIHLNHPSKALPLLKQSLTSSHVSSSKHNNILINYITYHISTSNYNEALRHIRHLLTEYSPSSAPMPTYIYDLILYYLLSTGKTPMALHLLRHNQVPQMFLSQHK